MKIKRYLDKDMRGVLKKVRDDQGPDAVILSNRRVDGGIEVVAALDYDAALMRHADLSQEMQPAQRATIASELLQQDEQSIAESAEPPIDTKVLSTSLSSTPLGEVQREISSLRDMVETQFRQMTWQDNASKSPLQTQMLRNLAMLGVAPDVATMLVDQVEELNDGKRIWDAPLAALANALPTAGSEILREGGVYALLGPTGVGKTTTIAKLAAQFAMHHDVDEMALVCADSFRIGAREHLLAFANIVGARVYAASSMSELDDLLVHLDDKKLVLIDTEGRSPKDRHLTAKLAAYGNRESRVRFLLTLSAAMQEASIEEALRTFSEVPLDGCVVTKLDEAAQLGCVAGSLIRHELPALWFSDGQEIPEDLYEAHKRKLWFVNLAVDRLSAARPVLDELSMAQKFARACHA